MASTGQENLGLVSASLRGITTPARNLWHGRILHVEGFADEEAAWEAKSPNRNPSAKTLCCFRPRAPWGLGRFFGDPSGITQFYDLTDTAFRCLLKGKPDRLSVPSRLSRRNLSSYWLAVLYDLAEQADDDPVLLARQRHIYSSFEWTTKKKPLHVEAYSATFAFARARCIPHVAPPPSRRSSETFQENDLSSIWKAIL